MNRAGLWLLVAVSIGSAGVQAREPAPGAPVPVTLAGAIEEAVAARLQLRIAAADVTKARGAVAEARGEYWPQLSVQANSTKTNTYDTYSGVEATATVSGVPVVVDIQRQVPIYNTSAALQASLNLYSGGLTRSRVAQARGNLAAATAELQRLRRETIIDVARAYWSVQKAQQRLDAANQAVVLAQRQTTLAETRADLGRGSRVELEDSRLGEMQKQVDRDKAQLDMQDAYRHYLAALGRDPGAAAVSPVTLLDGPDTVDIRVLLAPYLTGRPPELVKAEADLRAAQARRRAAQAEYGAKVDLIGRYTAVGRDDDALSGSISDFHRSDASVGVGVSWNLFNGLQTYHRVAQADEEITRARLVLDKTRQDLAASAHDRDNAIDRLKQDQALAQRQLDINREKERIARDGADAGRVSMLSYEAARLATREAESRLDSARIDLVSATMERLLMSAPDAEPPDVP